MDSQRCGPLDNRLPVFGVCRDRSYGSLARDDNLLFSHDFVAIAKTAESVIAGAIRCSGNMDCRPLNVDIQFKFLWRRTFSAGCLAVFCLRHIIVSGVYVCDVRLRRHIVRSVANDIAASHRRELPLQRSRTDLTGDFLGYISPNQWASHRGKSSVNLLSRAKSCEVRLSESGGQLPRIKFLRS